MALWWLSFVDRDAEGGGRFLGVALVEGEDLADAAMTAYASGCNPGGEVAGWELDAERIAGDPEARGLLEATPRNLLLSRERLVEIGHPDMGPAEAKEAEQEMGGRDRVEPTEAEWDDIRARSPLVLGTRDVIECSRCKATMADGEFVTEQHYSRSPACWTAPAP